MEKLEKTKENIEKKKPTLIGPVTDTGKEESDIDMSERESSDIDMREDNGKSEIQKKGKKAKE